MPKTNVRYAQKFSYAWQNDPDFKGNIAERIFRIKADDDFVLDDGLLE